MKNVKVNNCREDLKTFFDKELKYYLKTKLSHTPFIVLNEDNNSIDVVDKVTDLLYLFGNKPQTKVMIQWSGKWSSDFFTFTVGDLKKEVEFYNENNK